ncbi:hypothetical protein GUI12_02580 [Anaplasmataceae bacterium AB001_6]|nr:hypothetical protein GUI12_02580 [Anaplasmataceae bacterium AB001_6]
MTFKSNNLDELFVYLNEYDVKYINFCYVDLSGKCRNICIPMSTCDKTILLEGLPVRSLHLSSCDKYSSLSNLRLLPDIDSLFIEQFTPMATAVFMCNIIDEKFNIHPLDTRYTIKKLKDILKEKNIANHIDISFDIQCQIFDEMHCEINLFNSSYELDNKSNKSFLERDNIDNLADIRNEITNTACNMGMEISSHSKDKEKKQCCFNLGISNIQSALDHVFIIKYITQKISTSYGKKATFMPYTMPDSQGNCIFYRHALYDKDGKNIFENEDLGKNYIMGIMKNIKSLNALCNANTNSYKALKNKKSDNYISIVLDNSTKKNNTLLEVSFSDAISNPYLAMSAIIMAGIEGIDKNIHTKDLTVQDIKTSEKFSESLSSLEENNSFLSKIFTKEMIEEFIQLKRNEINEMESLIHPAEIMKYYNN